MHFKSTFYQLPLDEIDVKITPVFAERLELG